MIHHKYIRDRYELKLKSNIFMENLGFFKFLISLSYIFKFITLSYIYSNNIVNTVVLI